MPFYFLNYPRWFREAEATVVIQCHVRRFIATPWERRQVLRDLRYNLKRWAACVHLMSYTSSIRTLLRHGADRAKIRALIERDRVIRRAQEAIRLDQENVLLFFDQLPDDVKHKVVSFCPRLVVNASIMSDRAQAKQAIELARANEVYNAYDFEDKLEENLLLRYLFPDLGDRLRQGETWASAMKSLNRRNQRRRRKRLRNRLRKRHPSRNFRDDLSSWTQRSSTINGWYMRNFQVDYNSWSDHINSHAYPITFRLTDDGYRGYRHVKSWSYFHATYRNGHL